MSIEAGARAGLISPDWKTFEYLKKKPLSPKGNLWENAIKILENFEKSDIDAKYDKIFKKASSINLKLLGERVPGRRSQLILKFLILQNLRHK